MFTRLQKQNVNANKIQHIYLRPVLNVQVRFPLKMFKYEYYKEKYI